MPNVNKREKSNVSNIAVITALLSGIAAIITAILGQGGISEVFKVNQQDKSKGVQNSSSNAQKTDFRELPALEERLNSSNNQSAPTIPSTSSTTSGNASSSVGNITTSGGNNNVTIQLQPNSNVDAYKQTNKNSGKDLTKDEKSSAPKQESNSSADGDRLIRKQSEIPQDNFSQTISGDQNVQIRGGNNNQVNIR